jgi:transcriptional regulator with XRE-family HTH domain
MARTGKALARTRISVAPAKETPIYRLYIDEHLKAKGWTDAEAADIFGVAYATMYRWRKMQRQLDAEKIARFAEVMGIRPEELWAPPVEKKPYHIVNMLEALDDDSKILVIKLIQQLYTINALKKGQK